MKTAKKKLVKLGFEPRTAKPCELNTQPGWLKSLQIEDIS